MFLSSLLIALLSLGFVSLPGAAQTVTAPSQAATVLTQALNAGGGPQALGPIQDFSVTGTITYFWAGEPGQGSATVLGRAPDQFRLDANLPQGIRSYVVSHGVGSLKDPTGTVTLIPYHNTINVGVLTFPYLGIEARLNDPTSLFTDLGLVATDAGSQLHKAVVQRQFSPQSDPDGSVSQLTVTDYFLDPQTNLVSKVIDMTHPDETMTRSYPHEIDFQNYAIVNGVNVPMLVTEKVDGQTTWQLQLTSISFNVGLTDANFVLR